MKQHGWAFQCTHLFKALDEAGSAQYLPPDEELVKEYDELQKYIKHIETLYAIRLIGCTGYAFGKACEQLLMLQRFLCVALACNKNRCDRYALFS